MLSRVVYSAKKIALADNIGRRLENFFWRIWSSERIRDRLSGTEVAVQFSSINEGGYIRTTPTPSPRSSRSLQNYYKAARPESHPPSAPSMPPSTSVESGPLSSEVGLEGRSVTPTMTSPSTVAAKKDSVPKENRKIETTTTTRPPPILKKSSSESSDSSKTSTHASSKDRDTQPGTGAEDDDAVAIDDDSAIGDRVIPIIRKVGPSRRSTTTRFNEEVAVSIPKFSTSVPRALGDNRPRRSSGDSTSSQRSGKRNSGVVASTGANRHRPAVLPRRSSGTASLGNSRNPSYSKLARSPKSSAIAPVPLSSREQIAQSTRRARAASPHPSKERRRLSPSPPRHEEESDDEATQTQKDVSKAISEASEGTSGDSGDEKCERQLVDPNFRSEFVDRTRSSNRSLTNLPAFARKSSAAIPTAASFQATGTMGSGQSTSSAGRGTGREAFTNVTAPLKAPAAAGPEVAGAEAAEPLPKSKGQLTLLLEREKVRSSGQEQNSKKPDKP